MINPMKIMQIRSLWEKFQGNHPKFPMFLNAVMSGAIHEGSVIDICITEPTGEKIQTNLKISASDIELFDQLKSVSADLQQ